MSDSKKTAESAGILGAVSQKASLRGTLRAAKAVRILTVPPVFAALLAASLHFLGILDGAAWLIPLAGWSVLPLLAYVFPAERDVQRRRAVILSVAGYVIPLACALALSWPHAAAVPCLTYLLSGAQIALVPKLASGGRRLRISGHASGITGPFVYLALIADPRWLWGLLFLLPACLASLHMRRHTLAEFVLGSAATVLAMLVSLLVFPL